MKKILLVLSTTVLLGCNKEEDVRVTYEVMSDPYGFNVTYINQDGATLTTKVDISVWNYEFMVKEGTKISIIAQSLDSNGTIAARIYKNGKQIESSTNSGLYAVSIVNSNLK